MTIECAYKITAPIAMPPFFPRIMTVDSAYVIAMPLFFSFLQLHSLINSGTLHSGCCDLISYDRVCVCARVHVCLSSQR